MTRGSSTKFERTISSDGTDPKKWTLNYWMKRGTVNASESMAMLFNKNSGGTRVGNAGELNANNKLYFYNYDGSGEPATITSAVLRDPSAWYNIHLIWDTANATAGDRMRTFINGTEVTAFDTDTNPPLNEESMLFEGSQCTKLSIGYHPYNNSMYFDGYIAQVIACDGQAYLPTKFGEFDEDSPTIWKPIDPSGESLSFGTHGFWLDFKDSSALGNDVSGNNNDFTPANLDATDQATDTPTNNFCVMNPLNEVNVSGHNFTEGNTSVNVASGERASSFGTIGMTNGKWYMEMKLTNASGHDFLGIAGKGNASATDQLGWNDYQWSYYSATGKYAHDGSEVSFSGGDNTWGVNDIIGLAIDLDSGTKTLKWHKNGTYQSDVTLDEAASVTDWGAWFFACGSGTGSDDSVYAMNFGSPSFSISSGNADANGYGNFEYAVPSGYYALCTKNLAEYG